MIKSTKTNIYPLGLHRRGKTDDSQEAYTSEGDSANHRQGFWSSNQPSLNTGKCGSVMFSDNNDYKPAWKYAMCHDTKSFVCEASTCPEGKDTFYNVNRFW